MFNTSIGLIPFLGNTRLLEPINVSTPFFHSFDCPTRLILTYPETYKSLPETKIPVVEHH
jgi:hypothetical protein